jgi:class 3 adenylate cyclase
LCDLAVYSDELQKRDVDLDVMTVNLLTEKILSSRAALEGERKQVTVFFADVTGSTSEPALFLKRHP